MMTVILNEWLHNATMILTHLTSDQVKLPPTTLDYSVTAVWTENSETDFLISLEIASEINRET